VLLYKIEIKLKSYEATSLAYRSKKEELQWLRKLDLVLLVEFGTADIQDLDMLAGELRVRGVEGGQLFECVENIRCEMDILGFDLQTSHAIQAVPLNGTCGETDAVSEDCLEGQLNKGALTATLSQFIAHVCSAHGLEASWMRSFVWHLEARDGSGTFLSSPSGELCQSCAAKHGMKRVVNNMTALEIINEINLAKRAEIARTAED
ncbi:unnamed protein product, partial [Symbiodinium microadriaticum]